MSLGDRLKLARKSQNYTQDALAEAMGVSRGVITNLERNIVDPQPLIINTICNLLNINKDWLIDGAGEMDSLEISGNDGNKVLSEIYNSLRDLTKNEQLYFLDMLKSYNKHLKSDK